MATRLIIIGSVVLILLVYLVLTSLKESGVKFDNKFLKSIMIVVIVLLALIPIFRILMSVSKKLVLPW